MLNKTIVALTAATVLTSVSAALAYEAPENKLGDQYPFLEQQYQANSTKRVTTAKMSAPRIVLPSLSLSSSQFANPRQYVNGAPEDKIGDRYPLLEPKIQSQRVRGHATATRHHKQMKNKV